MFRTEERKIVVPKKDPVSNYSLPVDQLVNNSTYTLHYFCGLLKLQLQQSAFLKDRNKF